MRSVRVRGVCTHEDTIRTLEEVGVDCETILLRDQHNDCEGQGSDQALHQLARGKTTPADE